MTSININIIIKLDGHFRISNPVPEPWLSATTAPVFFGLCPSGSLFPHFHSLFLRLLIGVGMSVKSIKEPSEIVHPEIRERAVNSSKSYHTIESVFPILHLISGISDTNSILPTNDTGGRDNDERIAVKNA